MTMINVPSMTKAVAAEASQPHSSFGARFRLGNDTCLLCTLGEVNLFL